MSAKRLVKDVSPLGCYPHSLSASQGDGPDRDTALLSNSYSAMHYEHPVIGKYVADPDNTDICNPRYTGPLVPIRSVRPSTASSQLRSGDAVDEITTVYLPQRSSLRRPPTLPKLKQPVEDDDGGDEDEDCGDEGDDLRVSNIPHRPRTASKTCPRPTHLGDGSPPGEEVPTPLWVYKPVVYRLVKATMCPNSGSLFFPIYYGHPTPKDRVDPRGLPEAINLKLHGNNEDGLTFEAVEAHEDNLNKMCLYKIGPGAVAFRVVVQALEGSGMRCTTSNTNFNLLWAKRATPHILAVLQPYQKINHFPGTWGIGRKDSLAKNIARMKRQFGSNLFNIVPPSFILPGEEVALKEDVDSQTAALGAVPTYIVKPSASSCGKGIKLFRGMPPPVPVKANKLFVCQRYVADPLLVQDRKFDLRMYCVATSFDPLRLYLFDQGLVRFAAEKYRGPEKDLDNIHVHLTNYSVNKTAELSRSGKGKGFESDEPVDIKWCLSDLKNHLATLHGATAATKMWDTIYTAIKDVVIKTFLSIEADVLARMRAECRDPSGRGCFELYGLDLMVTKDLKVYLIEVNIMPSLATGSTLDKAVKARMLAHMLTLARVVPHDRSKAQNSTAREPLPCGPDPTGDRYVYPRERGAPRARENRVNVPLLKKFDDPNIAESVLTPPEVLMMIESDEELRCAGGFERIFPTLQTADAYFPLFSQGVTRSNYLLASWIAQKERATK